MKPLRIGMMADAYKPHVSGVTNYISLNKAFLEQMGHQVYIFTFGDESHQDDEANVIRSPGLKLRDTGFFITTRYSSQAIKLLRTMDVVHVHHPFVSGTLAHRYCRSRGIPVIFTNHTRYDLYAQYYLPGLPDLISEAALQTYLPSFCRRCDLVIAPSPGLRDVLRNLGVTATIDVVPNGVDLSRFRNPVCPVEREQFGFQKDDVVMIYTGRLGTEKNVSFLMRAFTGVAQAYDSVRLLVVGGGPERNNLEAWIQKSGFQKQVVFTGMVPYEEVPRYLAMADMYVTASVTEVHPLSVIEAMAAGLPVLGIRSVGVGDLVEDGETGYLVPNQDDLAAFTAKMIKLVLEPETRRRMGDNARQAACRYEIERTAQEMVKRYLSVVESSGERRRGWRVSLRRWLDQWAR